MTITQTLEIPADRRVYFEFLAPQEIPAGKVKVEVKLTPVVENNTSQQPEITVSKSRTPNTDALLEILSKIGGNIDPDEIRMERLSKHLK